MRFVHDPGHGWLEVPVSKINELGIADAISRFSYRNGQLAYLEEDCDAPLFKDAWIRTYGDWPQITEIYQQNTPIRDFARWETQE